MQKEKDTSQSKGQEDKGGLDSSQEHLESIVTISENSRSKTKITAQTGDNGEVVIRKFSTGGTLLDEIALDDKALVNLSNWLGWTRYD